MGNTNKHIKQSDFKTSHPSLHKAKLIQDKDNHHSYIQAIFKCQSKEYQAWLQNLKAANPDPNGYLLVPSKNQYNSDTGLCGNTGSLTNQYPFYPYLLSELIKQRNKKVDHRYFKQSQLWYTLFALVAALQQAKNRSLKLGDIKPENVFVNDAGQIKVANIYSWPSEKPSYWKVIEFDKFQSDSLLAPEDMALLQTNHLDNDGNQYSEIFAIGASIICAGILDNFSSVYNFKEKAINIGPLRDKKMAFGEGQRYSDIFKAIVLNLVEVSPSERLSSEELWDFIAPYRDPIMRKQQFVIQSAPQKVEATLHRFKNKAY